MRKKISFLKCQSLLTRRLCENFHMLPKKIQDSSNVLVSFFTEPLWKIASGHPTSSFLLQMLKLFIYIVEKWPNIPLKSCGVITARFSKQVWTFFNIMNQRVNQCARFIEQHGKGKFRSYDKKTPITQHYPNDLLIGKSFQGHKKTSNMPYYHVPNLMGHYMLIFTTMTN